MNLTKFFFPTDCTGKTNLSKALSSMITGLALHDIWETHLQRPLHTRYTNDGATRLDRVYLTDQLRTRKQGAETVVAAFFDHFAIIVRLNYSYQTIPRKSMSWRMSFTVLEDNTFRGTMVILWSKWKTLKNYIQTKRRGKVNASRTG